MNILSGYQGIAVHDALSMYLRYACLHTLCVTHYLRELTFVHEQCEQRWALHMQYLLRSIH